MLTIDKKIIKDTWNKLHKYSLENHQQKKNVWQIKK
jgi:hypothetical protein